MNDLVETWRTAPKRPGLAVACHAILVHIYPPGSIMGSRHVLTDAPLLIGRGAECDIRIHDSSVSRQHVRIQHDVDGYFLKDLGSTNGTFVNDTHATTCKLSDGDYLRVGNCIYRFLASDNLEAAYHEEIYRRAIIDALTEIHNKRYLIEYLDRELARSARFHRPLVLVLFDIDQFKAINDQFGHMAGDFTLRELASSIKTAISKEETFARYGGDEFVIVLPETTRECGFHFAERIRALVEKKSFRYEDRPYRVTISLGLAATNGDENVTSQELIQRGDERLYQAKHDGRNRVAG
jgi:diguanylate cyclase (GGDEF)-like protein